MSQVSIVGAYNTMFGAFVQKNRETGEVTDLRSIYELLIEAGRGALADAGVEAKEVDGVWVGSCAPGLFANQEHIASIATEIDPDGLRLKPMTRCEDACASGSVALYNALYAVEAGRAKVALVVGVEKMNLLDTKSMTHALATCSYWPEEGSQTVGGFPCLFAEFAKGYQAHYDLKPEEFQKMLATVAALGYRNGLDNPLAHFGKGGPSEKLGLVTAEAILALPPERNPLIADPLRLHDCSLVSDGAAAVVIMKTEQARSSDKKAVEIAGIGHVNERLALSKRADLYQYEVGKESVRRALAEAGIGIDSVDVAEVHDCFTISQLIGTETLGLSRDGRGGYDYLDGRFTRDDRCAVNLSGGLKAKGHPVGATGVSMHALIYKQLIGEPIGATLTGKAPEVGITFNIGGSAVTNCSTVLRRTR